MEVEVVRTTNNNVDLERQTYNPTEDSYFNETEFNTSAEITTKDVRFTEIDLSTQQPSAAMYQQDYTSNNNNDANQRESGQKESMWDRLRRNSWKLGVRLYEGADYIGGKVAYVLGLEDSRYQWVIEEIEAEKRKEAWAKAIQDAKKEAENEMIGQELELIENPPQPESNNNSASAKYGNISPSLEGHSAGGETSIVASPVSPFAPVPIRTEEVAFVASMPANNNQQQ